jgi:hypothetical protein
MTHIVTYAHRPKRAPRKKAQAAVITGPAIVSKRDRDWRQRLTTTTPRPRPRSRRSSPA